jgi:hypothetical protein
VRRAHHLRDPELLRQAHESPQSHNEHHRFDTGSYIKSAVYGGMDGVRLPLTARPPRKALVSCRI